MGQVFSVRRRRGMAKSAMRSTVQGLGVRCGICWYHFRDDGLAWLPRRGTVTNSCGDHLVALATECAAWWYLRPVGVPYEGADLWAQGGHFTPSWFAAVIYS